MIWICLGQAGRLYQWGLGTSLPQAWGQRAFAPSREIDFLVFLV